MILSNELEPGTRLVVRLLCEKLGLSPTPIKEALVALEQEGLVVSQARRGYSVAALDLEDIQKLYELREAIEGLAARLAAERGAEPLLEQMEAAQRAHLRQLEEGDLEGSGETDLAFHEALWQASENRHLIQVASTFPAKMRLVMTSIRAAMPERHGLAVQEHEQILADVRSGRPEQAEQSMREHIRQAARALLSHMGESAEN